MKLDHDWYGIRAANLTRTTAGTLSPSLWKAVLQDGAWSGGLTTYSRSLVLYSGGMLSLLMIDGWYDIPGPTCCILLK